MEARVERVEHELHLPTIKLQTIFGLVVLAVAMGMIIAPTLEARRGADMFQQNE